MVAESRVAKSSAIVKTKSKYSMFKYGYLVWLLVKKNVKNKYRRSYLGVLWTILLPLMEMLIMAMIFSSINGNIDSRIFIMCGVVVFGFHRESTQAALGSIINARGLIDRVYIPHIIFPLANTFSALANMFFSIVALICLAVITGFPLSWHFALVLLNFPALLMFSTGLSIALSAINVYFRDVGHLYTIFVQLWVFVSAVYMGVDVLPEFAQQIVRLNPLYYYVSNFRDLVMFHSIPSANNYLASYGMGILSLVAGYVIFRLLRKNFILCI